jgi:CheY-like chemotaxis protein
MVKSAQGEKQSVLIVEDSEDFSNLMKFVIEDMGYNGVQFPVDEENIIGWATEHKPIVILMDLALRRKGGMQFIEELKSDASTRHIPIVIITGRDLSSKEILALQVKGVRYLRKGRIEMHEIKQAITDAASHAKLAPTPREK